MMEEGLYLTARRSWPCVLSCEGYMCVCVSVCVGGWQMFGVFLEAVTPEPDLPMCPLMGHMEGHCCHPVPLCHTSCKDVLKACSGIHSIYK